MDWAGSYLANTKQLVSKEPDSSTSFNISCTTSRSCTIACLKSGRWDPTPQLPHFGWHRAWNNSFPKHHPLPPGHYKQGNYTDDKGRVERQKSQFQFEVLIIRRSWSAKPFTNRARVRFVSCDNDRERNDFLKRSSPCLSSKLWIYLSDEFFY